MEKTINLRGNQSEPQSVKSVSGGNKIASIFFAILALVIGIFLGRWFFSSGEKQSQSTGIFETKKNVVDSRKYQAVLLASGQTYFGKVSGENDQYVALNDVYYLSKSATQPEVEENATTNKKKEKPVEASSPDYSLQKLGTEVHGPENMYINRDQIVLIENLRDDSKVVSAIKNQETKK